MKSDKRSPAKATVGSLGHAAIVKSALRLIDTKGLEEFNIRALASDLGAGAMSVYYYFPSKAHLYEAVADQCILEMSPPPHDMAWHERLRHHAHEFFQVALRHPGFFPFLATFQMNTKAGMSFLNDLHLAFEESGLDPALQAEHYRAISYFIVGAGIAEARGFTGGPSAAEPLGTETIQTSYPAVARAYPYLISERHQSAFEKGLDILMNALQSAAQAEDKSGQRQA